MGKKRRRRRSRRQSWWQGTTGGMKNWLAVAIVALVAVISVGASVVALQRDNAAASADYTPQPIPTFGTPRPDYPDVVFIGDSFTGGSNMDSGPDARWTGILDKQLLLAEEILARGGSGYVAVGPSGETIPQVVPQIPVDTDLVVIFGSINDVSQNPDEIAAAAGAMYDAIRTQAPEADILVVGPAWKTGNPPRNILASIEGLKRATSQRGIDFVDAVEAGLLRDRPDLIGSDGTHPNDAGQVVIADFMRPLIEPRLPIPTPAP